MSEVQLGICRIVSGKNTKKPLAFLKQIAAYCVAVVGNSVKGVRFGRTYLHVPVGISDNGWAMISLWNHPQDCSAEI
ncbi:hypothetical protein [Costertonia aggregata]|uniref:Uncharacterized protein n=1 Tax=Costertonia aggregata TaxID=343403 RepID=A0A7H9AR75_9FLAO|nr:hypothetical protein [Costertonia aggregata]QLG45916.1 hypothetical protein HYG79_11335 [Costertonia aggregata]